MSAQAETQPSHLPAEHARWLTPASELEEAELGERVADHAATWDLIRAHCAADQPFEAALELLGSVADAAAAAHKPIPAAWWPPSAGPAPGDTL
jgi:hypothetical protein